jgi:hypothetical protein
MVGVAINVVLLLSYCQIIDKGSQALTNVEVLAHITSLEDKYERDGRTQTIPEDIRKVMRDVGLQLQSMIDLVVQRSRPFSTTNTFAYPGIGTRSRRFSGSRPSPPTEQTSRPKRSTSLRWR